VGHGLKPLVLVKAPRRDDPQFQSGASCDFRAYERP
jgi:hypothetical protein